jgi:hypothetical protein
MGGMGGDGDHGMLVQRVKEVQRQEGGKDKWAQFISTHGGGKKDPALRSATDLQEFLDSAGEGSHWSSAPSSDPEVLRLAQQVKSGQKASEEFKEAWGTYCEKNCGNVRDPSKHDLNSLQSFLAIAPSVNMPENDNHHMELVQTIKAGQRNSADFKTAWHTYCQNAGFVKFDPAKHEVYFLEQFLSTNEVPESTGDPASKRMKMSSPYQVPAWEGDDLNGLRGEN